MTFIFTGGWTYAQPTKEFLPTSSATTLRSLHVRLVAFFGNGVFSRVWRLGTNKFGVFFWEKHISILNSFHLKKMAGAHFFFSKGWSWSFFPPVLESKIDWPSQTSTGFDPFWDSELTHDRIFQKGLLSDSRATAWAIEILGSHFLGEWEVPGLDNAGQRKGQCWWAWFPGGEG